MQPLRRQFSLAGRCITALLAITPLVSLSPALAQGAPTSASASSAANAAGTTVNNQNNSQINTNTFYGFGPGINCPTSTFAASGFGGSGSGNSGGDVLGAFVDSDTYGGIVSFTLPIGPANAAICSEIGRAQQQLLEAQVSKVRMDAAKTQADLTLVTMLKCVEILRVASLRGPFAQVCQGVVPRGMAVAQTPQRPVGPAPAAAPVRQRFDP